LFHIARNNNNLTRYLPLQYCNGTAIDDCAIEFKALIQSLSKEEYWQLEENIIQEGCRDALIVWGNSIINGHNRFAICAGNGLEYRTKEKQFAEHEEALLLWIIKNQLGRRNL
jgi:hypothetical protein